MKVSKKTLANITADYLAVLNSFDSAKWAHIKSLSEMGARWEVWDKIRLNRMYDNDHPCWKEGHWGKRVLPHDPAFDSYPDNTNDDTLDTALRNVQTFWKENNFFLIPIEVHIQCTSEGGEVGTFAKLSGRRITPVCEDLISLYLYCRKHGIPMQDPT